MPPRLGRTRSRAKKQAAEWRPVLSPVEAATAVEENVVLAMLTDRSVTSVPAV